MNESNFIRGMFEGGAFQSIERLAQFTEHRHKVISHNIANMSTPRYRPQKLSPKEFQGTLSEAIDARRRNYGGPNRELNIRRTRHMTFQDKGIDVRMDDQNSNIMFHDQNNRSLEETMKNLATNAMAYSMSTQLATNQFSMINTAISERV